jgi:hypothetical protein
VKITGVSHPLPSIVTAPSIMYESSVPDHLPSNSEVSDADEVSTLLEETLSPSSEIKNEFDTSFSYSVYDDDFDAFLMDAIMSL